MSETATTSRSRMLNMLRQNEPLCRIRPNVMIWRIKQKERVDEGWIVKLTASLAKFSTNIVDMSWA